ncbi:unnamed protein product, partial [Brachionus calyciflorus]
MKLEKKNPKLSNRVKNTVQDVLLSSTSHGLPNIIRANNKPVKLMWTFFTLISTCLCAYMITQSFIKYFTYEVTTKTRIKNEFMSIFPTVTVCNLNFFTSEALVKFIKLIEKNYTNLDSPFGDSFNSYAKAVLSKNNISNNDLSIFGDSLEKLIVNCIYIGPDCNMSQIRFYNHPNYGNCFTLNSGYDQNEQPIPLWTTVV